MHEKYVKIVTMRKLVLIIWWFGNILYKIYTNFHYELSNGLFYTEFASYESVGLYSVLCCVLCIAVTS